MKFLNELGRFLAAWLAEQQARRLPNPLTALACGQGSLTLDGRMLTLKWRGGRTLQRSLDVDGGFWFERVVAAAFRTAGADEVRVGMQWQWPGSDIHHQAAIGPHFRSEIDVIARFGARFFAISCKCGDTETLASVGREIEAAALCNLGRLSVPLVARPWIAAQCLNESHRGKKGAAYLDLTILSDSSLLQRTLADIWRQRSTLER